MFFCCFLPVKSVSIFVQLLQTYTEQKWKRYTTIIYILQESVGQNVLTEA